MKTLSSILLLAMISSVAFYSCNSSEGKQKKFVTHKEAADTQRIKMTDTIQSAGAIKEIPVRYGYMPNDEAKNFLRDVHLEKLIISSQDADFPWIYNGFFGEDHYRIEIYVSGVQADSANPMVMQLKGLTRFKKSITPFSGTITIDSVFKFKDFNYDYSEYLEERPLLDSSYVYEGDTFVMTSHIKGRFEIKEDSSVNGSGIFTGNIFMDVVHTDNGEYAFWFNTVNETRRGGLLLDGVWTSNNNKEQKPIICARDLFMFANDILADFSYGEREIEINEKYRALGWDNFWENEEWWSEGTNTKSAEPKTMMIWSY